MPPREVRRLKFREIAALLHLDEFDLDAPSDVQAVPFELRRPMTPEEIFAERERRRAARGGEV